MDPAERSNHDSFARQAGARLRAHWLAKALGISLGMTAFFAAYFLLLRHPLFPVTIMPVTAIDRFVEFRPGALAIYLSLWIYVPLGVGLLRDRRELYSHALASAAVSAIGLGIFLLWPTAVPPPGETWASGSAFSFLKAVDATGNACPSLHVAFAVLTAIRLQRLLSEMGATLFVKAANWLWCVGIVYSTLATRQHVAFDALAGAVLGGVVELPRVFRARSRRV
ncbi:MAG TPA: phosphatase PAP2 family protein [Opitutaceae bacterium]|nr:phosphatase PAP2 family protein [Opitutaceae bacterium]